jgi:hypothetical protein
LLSKAGDSLAIEQTGEVTLSAAATVKAGTTLTIGTSGKVTASGTNTLTVAGTLDVTAGTLTVTGGKVTAAGSGQIIGAYPLSDTDGAIPIAGTKAFFSGTSIQTADADGKQVVNITVTSKAGKIAPDPAAGEWGDAGEEKPTTAKFSDMALDLGAAITDGATKDYAIKNTNLGLLYYAGDTYLYDSNSNQSGFVTNTELTGPQPEVDPDVYIAQDNSAAFKWKVYTKNGDFKTTTTFGLLLYSGDSTKTVTLEIDEAGANDTWTPVVTIKIDYSGVTFPPVVSPSP